MGTTHLSYLEQFSSLKVSCEERMEHLVVEPELIIFPKEVKREQIYYNGIDQVEQESEEERDMGPWCNGNWRKKMQLPEEDVGSEDENSYEDEDENFEGRLPEPECIFIEETQMGEIQPELMQEIKAGGSSDGDMNQEEEECSDEESYPEPECIIEEETRPRLYIETSSECNEFPFTCKKCGQGFCDSGELIFHVSSHFGVVKYSCEHCGQKFSKQENFSNHLCMYTSKKLFQPHINTNQSKEKPFMRAPYNGRFAHREKLLQYVQASTKVRPFTCDICGKKFTRRDTLMQHCKLHRGVSPRKTSICDVCGKGFTRYNHLLVHKRVHTGEKPYFCTRCPKSFAERSNLIRHMKTNHSFNPEKPNFRCYKCDLCSKMFTRAHHLQAHNRVHTGEKPFKCHICDRCFSENSNLNKHIKRHETYRCDGCDMTFSSKKLCSQHVLSHVKPS